ncbi:TMV resistance protein N-like [Neltuma alba]|uniref:TMV resistance protein N-like n=1 Tax=Neltuma alba TaxID=207710 RepID=UPI0010A5A119|nr:TMV resistance protein N-like [Prosopis alba]
MDSQSSLSSKPVQVYLSFRGDDNSRKFTDDLRCGIESRDLQTLGDDKKFETRDSIILIPPHLLKSIEESFIFFVIFSRNFASSIWCLQELSKIADFINNNDPKHTVIPIFYDVDPYEVQQQIGIYGKAFAEYEKSFCPDLVRKWRLAMTLTANLPGWVVQNEQIKKHKQVIFDIHKLLNTKLPEVVFADHQLIGMKSRVQEVKKLLDLDSNDEVRVVGICGMCGIGKTATAAVLYNKISHRFDASYFLPFDASCFLPDACHVSNSNGVSPLQQFFRQTLKMEDLEIRDIQEGIFLANPKLRHQKTLIVLDGVNPTQNLETLNLAVKSNWLGAGSRIIITTRDERLLKVLEANDVYKVELLSKDESLQLFCKKAFKCNFLVKQHQEYSNSVLQYCNGLPLAISSFGSTLFHLRASTWMSDLTKSRKDPDHWMMEILKTCFDELDHMKKQIFLDIACFFTGKEINYVKEILQDCGFSAEEITLLVERFLIDILDQRIRMHGMFQKMGREIVRQESPQEPGERSRLWSFDDICHVMTKNTATEKVEAIVLDMEDSESSTLRIEALSQMGNLRLLIFHNVNFVGTLNCLPNKLRHISWHQYPLACLPSGFEPHALVELIMPESNITQIWEGNKVFPKLRNLNLRGSKNLTKSPDFRGTPNLERICPMFEIRPFEELSY